MAHLRSLVQSCRRCQSKRATQRVMTTRNETFGDYCDRCANVVLRQVQAQEDRLHGASGC